MVAEVHASKPRGEECGELAPEHPAPGVVLLEQLVQPVQLRLGELCVVEQPRLVFGQETIRDSRLSLPKHWEILFLYGHYAQNEGEMGMWLIGQCQLRA